MIVLHNVPVYSICWLNHANGGIVGTFYEPENIDELKEICSLLYQGGKQFDLIGHTSNIYFLPNYSVDYMVSTRKCNTYTESEDEIVCDCGVSVMKLARLMVDKGMKGFEGLIDLPGTVAASIYGNASCFGCSINDLLISCELLCPHGLIRTIKPEDLQLSQRSSTLKRGELNGVILSVTLRKEQGDRDVLKRKAELYHRRRMETQPGFKDNLGSIYGVSGGWSYFSILPRLLTNLYTKVFLSSVKDIKERKRKKMAFLFHIIGGDDVFPYVYAWNRYIWKDIQSHELFWKYHKLHKKMFKKSLFEIEIKGKKI